MNVYMMIYIICMFVHLSMLCTRVCTMRTNSLGHKWSSGLDVKEVTQCTGCVSANTRPHQLRWGDRGVWASHTMHVQHRWLALGLHSHTAWQPMVVLTSFSLGFIFRATAATAVVTIETALVAHTTLHHVRTQNTCTKELFEV